MPKILVISDLHINIKDSSNDFLFEDEEFISYLERCHQIYDYIISNGDSLDLEERGSQSQEDKYKEIELARPKLISYLIKSLLMCSGDFQIDLTKPNPSVKKCIFVAGNHDWHLQKILPNHVCQSITLRTATQSIHILHCHQADVFFGKKTSCLGNCITRGNYLCEKYIYKDFDLVANNIHHCFNPKDDMIYENYAIKLHQTQKYDCIVTSHTHRAYLKRIDKLLYCNTRSVCNKTTIDTMDKIVLDVSSISIKATHLPGNMAMLINNIGL